LYIADTIAKSIENYISSQENLLMLLERDTDIRSSLEQSVDSDIDKVNEKLQTFLSTRKSGFEGLQLFNRDGMEVARYLISGEIESEEIRKSINQALESKIMVSSKIVYDKANNPYIYLVQPVWKDDIIIGAISAKLSIEKIYINFIEPIKFEKKGYASVKDSAGVFIMHPRPDQIGKDVLKIRKEEYPELDWSDLEEMFSKQMNGERGTGIYKSVWVTDDLPKSTLKFNGYSPVLVGSDFWIVTVSSDYYEATKIIRNNLYTTILAMSIIGGAFFLSAFYVIYMLLNQRKLKEIAALLARVQELNKELELDIQQRIKLEEDLRTSRKKFIKLFNTGTQFTFMTTSPKEKKSELNIIEVNDHACKKLGYEREMFQRMKLENLISSSDLSAFRDAIESCVMEAQVYIETNFKNANGEQFPVELFIHEFHIEKESFLLLMGRDITSRRQKDELIEKNRGIMIYKSRLAAMGEMIASIAHQWRQPLSRLNLIVGNIEDAYNYGELEEVYFKEQILKTQSIIQDMSSIIEEFLYFFNPKNETIKFNLSKTINTSIEMLRDRLAINEIQTRVYCDETIELEGYLSQLSQVLLNIVNNAIDALKGISGDRLIEFNAYEHESDIVLEISDNGGGVLNENLEKIFTSYFSTKEKGEGTGIGLYISKVIIERNFNGLLIAENSNNGLKISIRMRGQSNETRDDENFKGAFY